MIDESLKLVCEELAQKHHLPVDAVQALAIELEKTGGTSVRFDIDGLGGRGLWKQGKPASVGNGFDAELNHMLTDLCATIAQSIREREPASPSPEETAPQNMNDTIGLMPTSLMPNAWWPDEYGIVPDILDSFGTLRYAYFQHRDQLLILQYAEITKYDTAGYIIMDVRGEGTEYTPENLVIETETGDVTIQQFTKTAE